MNNENKPSVIAELTAALASKDKELRDTQAELQKARKALEAKEGEQNHGNDKESNS